MRRVWLCGVLLAASSAAAEAEDLTCSNGIVGVALHLDSSQGTITMEGASYRVNATDPRIAFSVTDPAGDKIDYVLDRTAHRLIETDHDRLPDGSFKTISLTFACTKTAE
jgi:hypothetical protein